MKINDMRYYKFFMLLFNILIIGTGVLAIASSILYMREKKLKPELEPPLSRGLLAFFITVSLFMIVTGILGCIAALKLHMKTLYVQICFYIFLISVEVIVGVGAALVNAWGGSADDLRLNFYKNITAEEDMARQKEWNYLQVQLYCCGVDGPHDYAVMHREIPPSCCATAHPLREGGAKRQLHATCLNERTYYMRGCEDAFKSRKYRNDKLVALASTILILLELGIVVLSLAMVTRIRRQRRQLQQNLQAHFES